MLDARGSLLEGAVPRIAREPVLRREIPDSAMPVMIDPAVQFGRPVIAGHGISTAAIVARVDAGERPGEIAADYEMTVDDVGQVVLYERAA